MAGTVVAWAPGLRYLTVLWVQGSLGHPLASITGSLGNGNKLQGHNVEQRLMVSGFLRLQKGPVVAIPWLPPRRSVQGALSALSLSTWESLATQALIRHSYQGHTPSPPQA